MRLIPDATRRFLQRPHYDDFELDKIFEDIVTEFLTKRHGHVAFPIATDDLEVLLEQRVDDLDTSADLSELGDGVEGVTDFFPKKKPHVRISAHFTEGPHRENRLRTTLAHEFGHVHLHNYLFQMDGTLELFQGVGDRKQQCRREGIEGRGRVSDWMEWQAGYASGAILMPVTAFRSTIAATGIDVQSGPVATDSAQGQKLVDAVASAFSVSRDAARVRLSQGKYLGHAPPQRLDF